MKLNVLHLFQICLCTLQVKVSHTFNNFCSINASYHLRVRHTSMENAHYIFSLEQMRKKNFYSSLDSIPTEKITKSGLELGSSSYRINRIIILKNTKTTLFSC